MSSNRITVIIVAAAAVAIVAVLTVSGGVDLPSFGGGDGDDEERASTESPVTEREDPSKAEERLEGKEIDLPDNPDDVRGTDSYALTRPANLRRALAVLDRRRRQVEGVFDGLRIAPGRIDTVIIHPDDRRTNIQVRPDLEIGFETTHDFPTQADFRKGGLAAREVDARAPARLLRGIDEQRSGSAAHDVDYIVIGKSIIDFNVEVNGYMRIRTPRPRYFRLVGRRVEAIG